MSDIQNSGDQSMDDILASIRKIISEDNSPAARRAASSGRAVTEPVQAGGEQHDAMFGPAGPSAGIGGKGASPDRQGPAAGGASAPAAVSRPLGSKPLDSSSSEATWPFVANDRPSARGPTGQSLQSKLASLDPVPVNAPQALGPAVRVAAEEPAVEPVADASPADPVTVVAAPAADEVSDRVSLAEGNRKVISDPDDTSKSEPLMPAAGAVKATPGARVDLDLAKFEAAAVGGRISGSAAPGSVAQSGTVQAPVAPGAVPLAALVAGAVDTSVAEVDDSDKAAPTSGDTASPADIASGAASVVASTETAPVSGPVPGEKSLEALVVEALQPVLREWLDAKLPALVERKIGEEIARLMQERSGKSGA